jgi:hypothetical protein
MWEVELGDWLDLQQHHKSPPTVMIAVDEGSL